MVSAFCSLQLNKLDLNHDAILGVILGPAEGIIVLLAAGVLSIGLETIFGKEGENGWIEGVAILAAVAVVTLVTAVNNYQKERQFRELSALADAGQVCTHPHACHHAQPHHARHNSSQATGVGEPSPGLGDLLEVTACIG